jgi:uncharacterized iron-regulated membrane protein
MGVARSAWRSGVCNKRKSIAKYFSEALPGGQIWSYIRAMSSLQLLCKNIWQNPRQLLVRKAMFQVHLWTGILFTLYIVLISVTGASLVFTEEMDHSLNQHLYRVADRTPELATAGQVLATLKQSYPNHRVTGLSYPNEERDTFRAFLATKERRDLTVYLHPNRATVVGIAGAEANFLRWLQDLHFNLLAGRTGRIANGIGGLALLLMCLSGIVVWWPGIKNWVRALKIDPARSWKRINYDSHSAVGFWTLAIVSVWGITGAYFAWPNEFRWVLSQVATVTTPLKNPESVLVKAAKVDVAVLEAKVREIAPAGMIESLSIPKDAKGAVRFALRPKAEGLRGDLLYFDQFSGGLLEHRVRKTPTAAGDVVLAWIGPLHFGDFGGTPVKVLYVFLGLCPALLAVTGVLMWWNRAGSKWWAKRRAQKAVEASVETVRDSQLDGELAPVNSKVRLTP